MALIHFDNFTMFHDTGSMSNVYSGASQTSSSWIAPNGSTYIRPINFEVPVPVSQRHNTAYVGMLAYVYDPFNEQNAFSFYSVSDSNPQVKFSINSIVNKVSLIRGGSVLLEAAVDLPKNVWLYIEVGVKFDPSDGWMIMKINGNVVASVSGVSTRNSTSDTVLSKFLSRMDRMYATDMYLCTGAGSQNNTFLGDVKIETIYPNGNGNSSDFTGSDSDKVNNYLLVNEQYPFSGGTSGYVQSSGVGDKDTYTFGDLTSTTGTIAGVRQFVVSSKTDAGAVEASHAVRSGGSDYDGGSLNTTVGFSVSTHVNEENPATSDPWEISEVNGSEFGVEITA